MIPTHYSRRLRNPNITGISREEKPNFDSRKVASALHPFHIASLIESADLESAVQTKPRYKISGPVKIERGDFITEGIHRKNLFLKKEREFIAKNNLFQAILDNNEENVQKLISENHVDINTTDEEGSSFLEYALHMENERIAKILMDAGANCFDKTPPTGSLFEDLYLSQNIAFGKTLLKAIASQKVEFVKIIFLKTEAKDRKRAFDFLFKCGLDFYEQNTEGKTLLTLVINDNNIDNSLREFLLTECLAD